MDSGEEEHVCHACKIVATYIDLSNGFTQDLSAALIGPMQLIYLALIGIWIIFQGYRLILILATIMDVAKEFIFVIIAWFMRSEEHTSELQSLMRISYAVFCLKKKNTNMSTNTTTIHKQ